MKTPEKDHIKALIRLIETESEDYGEILKPELAALIKADPSRVQSVIEEDFHSEVPRSVIQTMEEICWEDLSASLAGFSGKINPDLEEGLYLLSKFVSPALTRTEVEAPLDAMAQELRPVLLNVKNYTEIAAVLGHYFFDMRGYVALPSNPDIKDISFGRFLRKGRGSSLCVACLYACIGQRFAVETNLVDLAGRILIQLKGNDETLFIDPLDKGKILAEKACREYIQTRQIEWNDEFLAPLSSRQIVRRFIANMIFVLNKLKDERKLKYLRNYLEIIQG